MDLLKKGSSLFLLLLLGAFPAIAQNSGDVEIFSQNGENFHVILNGQKMHENPETNVKLSDLSGDYYKVKIIFTDSSIESIDKNIMVKEGHRLTYVIKKNLFDNYALKPFSDNELEDQGESDSGGSASDQNTAPSDSNDSGTSGQEGGSGSGSGSEQTGAGTQHEQGISISVNMSSSDSSFSTSIETKSSSSSTSTQTEMSGGQGWDQEQDQEWNEGEEGSDMEAQEEEEEEEGPLPDYNGPTGCDGVMSDTRFTDAKGSIRSKSFADSRMTQAQRVVKSNCLLTDQIKELVELFEFENDRLEFAKFAYDHTYDQGNYYKIHDSFEFSSSIDELDEHLELK